MTALLFTGSCAIWLAGIIGLAIWSPIGKYPFVSMFCFVSGSAGMLAMVKTFPQKQSPLPSLCFVVALSLLARIVFLAYPVGNDVYRYVWEGAIQAYGFNPYVYSPDNPVLAHLAEDKLATIWTFINHKSLPAAYPPSAQLLFRGLAAIDPEPFLFKLTMAGFDMGICFVLALMLKHRQMPYSRLLLYAANPLVIVYATGEGHLDVVQAFFLILSLYLCDKGRFGIGFVALGIAVTTKYLAAMALPFLITAKNKHRVWWVLLPMLSFWPFIDAGSMLFFSLGQFGLGMHYNDSITVIVRYLFGDATISVTLVLLSVCFVWIFLFFHQRQYSVYLAIGCLLLFMPTLHPWYLILIVPFMVFYPSKAWLYLQAAMAFTFPVVGIETATGVFQELHWIKPLIYGPFYGLLLWGFLRGGRLFQTGGFPPARSISVVIPVLNEERWITQCLQSVMRQPHLKECIVVDGGSRDTTIAKAEAIGARIVNSAKGRGVQIEAGVKQCKGDVIMSLHADCTLQMGLFSRLLARINAMPYVVGGAVAMTFTQSSSFFSLISWLNNARTRLTGIAFGDQAQFFRTGILDKIGGYPPIMLMEDIELSLRLKEQGRLLFLNRGVTVSSRRWQKKQSFRKVGLVLRLFTAYLLERRFGIRDRQMAEYYRTYYGK